MGNAYSQSRPPAPTFTEVDLPDLRGKVYIITGGASGVGAELAEILYNAGGTVYIVGRSEANALHAISRMTECCGDSAKAGKLNFLHVDLADLATIKPAASKFLAAEQRLDILFNNAGVSLPPVGSTSAQGLELMMATNAVGPHLLTQLLLPLLRITVESRVVWTSSLAAEASLSKGGFTMEQIATPGTDQVFNYNASKFANQLLSAELSRAEPAITSVAQNPGNLQTNLLRHMPRWQRTLVGPILYHAKMGAYTELHAGLSPNVRSGDYVIPWGRRHTTLRQDFIDATKSLDEGGTELSRMFKVWCDGQVASFL